MTRISSRCTAHQPSTSCRSSSWTSFSSRFWGSPQSEGFHQLRFPQPGSELHPLSDRIDRFAVLIRDGKEATPTGCIAIPYFENLSLLAYRNDILDFCHLKEMPSATDSDGWDKLRDTCLDWQDKNPEPNIFFSCPIAHPQSIESYNCLFFEILLSRCAVPDSECGLGQWLGSGFSKQAAHILRDLCYRSYRHTYREALRFKRADPKGGFELTGDEDEAGGKFEPTSGPYVWRHWYNTLNGYLATKSPEYRNQMHVQPLFGEITTAGEWYLALPAYSAAPEVGWDLIQLFTSSERELQRVYLGVGLPTRKAFYFMVSLIRA